MSPPARGAVAGGPRCWAWGLLGALTACGGSTRAPSAHASLPEEVPAESAAVILGRGCPATHREALALVGTLARESTGQSGIEVREDRAPRADGLNETSPSPWPSRCDYAEGSCHTLRVYDRCTLRTDFRCGDLESLQADLVHVPCDQPDRM
ncbi:MAG: hypothetical protein J0L92_13985 [Deltaproteobacteria bacterium]|nr:hypothetical protein [Deltaproteobacteria bacterium]